MITEENAVLFIVNGKLRPTGHDISDLIEFWILKLLAT